MVHISYLVFQVLLVLQPIFTQLHVKQEYCDEQYGCIKGRNIGRPNLLGRPVKLTPKQQVICDACDVAIPALLSLIERNKTEHFEPLAIFFCNEFKIEDPVVCDLVVKQYVFSALNTLRDSKLNASDYCDVAFNCKVSTNPLLNWNITLPSTPKPPVVPPTPPKPGSPTVRILQFSDIHIDFEYQPGAPGDCLDPLCCRNQSTPNPNSTSTGAGYWGDYRNCDIPLWTVENMFDYISKNEDFDYIYWTGDLPPHNVWNQTKDDQLAALDTLTKLFLKYFPKKVVYPGIGNHEAAPCNLFPPPYVKEDNITWLYSALANNWTATGLPDYLRQNITNGAFFTLLLYPGVRLISINMNYCANLNFWIFINTTDPLGQLTWLANTLQYSEDHNEKVHIIGHIDPNGGCLQWFAFNYYRIVNRYENTIAGQFFGHTHTDQFELFFDFDNITRATNIAYVAPSVTTFSYLNPGYRIYTVDGFYAGTSFRVLDHETRYLNLTEANKVGELTWRHEYSAKQTYGLNNLFPQDWSNLIDSILNNLDSPLFDLLYKYYHKSSDAVSDNCDKDCKIRFLCSFKQSTGVNIPCGGQ